MDNPGGFDDAAGGGPAGSERSLLGMKLLPMFVCLGLAALPALWYLHGHMEAVTARLTAVLARTWSMTFSYGNATYLAAVALTFLIEIPFTGYRQSSLARVLKPSKSTIADIFGIVCVLTGLGGILTFIFSLGISSYISDRLIAMVPHGALAMPNALLQTFWLLIVSDFLKYWLHYFQHKVPFWWEAHKFHHAATEMNIITSARGHPFQGAADVIFMAIPTALIAGDAEQFLLLNVVTTVLGGLHHSMLAWRFGWLGRWIVNSPVNHRIHHSDMPEHFDCNFASTFVLWDRLFGTYYTGPNLNPAVNVTYNHYNKRSLPYDILLCLQLSVTRLFRPVLRVLGFAR